MKTTEKLKLSMPDFIGWWHDAQKDPPPYGELVLTYDPGDPYEICLARRDRTDWEGEWFEYWHPNDAGQFEDQLARFWMQLPPAPSPSRKKKAPKRRAKG